jgi:hypothetical protein
MLDITLAVWQCAHARINMTISGERKIMLMPYCAFPTKGNQKNVAVQAFQKQKRNAKMD